MKTCIKCGKSRPTGRKMCSSCYKEDKSAYAKERYKKYGHSVVKNICVACKNVFESIQKKKLCSCCKKETFRTDGHKINSLYVYHVGTSIPEHRFIACKLLGRKLQTNEVIHHLNENPKDNRLKNLIVLDRRTHGRLHSFLRLQRVIIEKSINENVENCWNNLRVPMTTTWLETASVKVIKLWEIGQSASEPLNSVLEHEEGSETMHNES